LNAFGADARLARPCGETDVTHGDSCKRFDHEVFLSCPHAGLEIADGLALAKILSERPIEPEPLLPA
jgi:hypothetical protein